jgi:hypothetical protein
VRVPLTYRLEEDGRWIEQCSRCDGFEVLDAAKDPPRVCAWCWTQKGTMGEQFNLWFGANTL